MILDHKDTIIIQLGYKRQEMPLYTKCPDHMYS